MRILRIVPLTVVTVAAVVAATLTPGPRETPDPVTLTYEVAPAERPLACPGPLTVPVGEIRSGDADLDSGSDDVDFAIVPDEGTAADDGTAIDATVATQIERVGGGDIAGLAAIACPVPMRDQWILAGSTAVGASARLVLTNPSGGAVRVEVSLHGPVGEVGTPTTVTVAPGTQQIRLLEGLETEVPVIAVHLRAGGVGVAAALQDSRLDGFTAAGTDWAGHVPQLGTDLVVPVAGPSDEDAPGAVRILAPDGADVTLTLIGEDGPVPWLGDSTLTLEEGVVTDVPIPESEVVAVEVDATAPVAASALIRVARPAAVGDGALALDHAWTPGDAYGEPRAQAVAVPAGDVELVVYSRSAQTFALTSDDGEEVTAVELDERTVRTASLDVAPGTVLTSESSAVWALVVRDEDAGFVATVSPEPTEREPVSVSVGLGPYVSRP